MRIFFDVAATALALMALYIFVRRRTSIGRARRLGNTILFPTTSMYAHVLIPFIIVFVFFTVPPTEGWNPEVDQVVAWSFVLGIPLVVAAYVINLAFRKIVSFSRENLFVDDVFGKPLTFWLNAIVLNEEPNFANELVGRTTDGHVVKFSILLRNAELLKNAILRESGTAAKSSTP